MKSYEIKLLKKLDLLEDLKMPKEFYTHLNFSFIMIYIIHKILVSLKNQPTKNSIFKCFFKKYNIDFYIFLNNFFQNI